MLFKTFAPAVRSAVHRPRHRMSNIRTFEGLLMNRACPDFFRLWDLRCTLIRAYLSTKVASGRPGETRGNAMTTREIGSRPRAIAEQPREGLPRPDFRQKVRKLKKLRKKIFIARCHYRAQPTRENERVLQQLVAEDDALTCDIAFGIAPAKK